MPGEALHPDHDESGERDQQRDDGDAERAREGCERGPDFEQARPHDDDREDGGEQSEAARCAAPRWRAARWAPSGCSARAIGLPHELEQMLLSAAQSGLIEQAVASALIPPSPR